MKKRLPNRNQEVVTEWWRDVNLLRVSTRQLDPTGNSNNYAYGAEIDVWALAMVFLDMTFAALFIPGSNLKGTLTTLQVIDKYIANDSIY